MKYTERVLKEAMRICTTVSLNIRHCREDHTLSNGMVLPKGTGVFVHAWAIHHDPVIFPQPEVFDPDRFCDPQGVQATNWFGFGSGARSCVGWSFAMQEMKITLAMLLRRYTLTLGPKAAALPKPVFNSSLMIHMEHIDILFTPSSHSL